MSMSTHVVGIRANDALWTRMKKVWDACEEAKVSPPKEVLEYFDHTIPNSDGVEVSVDVAKAGWTGNAASGFIIEIAKLPKNITHLRFWNSW